MPNLIEYWDKFTETDKECILRAVKRWPRYARASTGMLPMMDLGAVMEACTEYKDLIKKTSGLQNPEQPPFWALAHLADLEAVLSKLPAQPPEQQQVLWVAKGEGNGQ